MTDALPTFGTTSYEQPKRTGNYAGKDAPGGKTFNLAGDNYLAINGRTCGGSGAAEHKQHRDKCAALAVQAALTNEWLSKQGLPDLPALWVAYHYPPPSKPEPKAPVTAAKG